MNENVKQLISFFGGQTPAGDALGVSQGTVSGWLRNTHGMDAVNALKAEKISGGALVAVELCPRLKQLDEVKAA